MDFDFNIILVPATLILGFIWLLDTFWLKQHQNNGLGTSQDVQNEQQLLEQKKQDYIKILQQHDISYDDLNKVSIDDAPVAVRMAEREYRDAKRHANISTIEQVTKKENFLVRWAHDYFFILALVLVVRSFIIEPFNVPSSSMVPSLYTGDFIAVNKFAYGIRLPLTNSKIIDIGSPQHGDVAVFRYPKNPKVNYVKRVIGLPGDTVSFNQGKLYLNGKLLTTQPVDFKADEQLVKILYTPIKSSNPQMQLTAEDAMRRGETEEIGASYYQEKLGEHTYLRRYLSPGLQINPYSEFLNMPINHNSSWSVTVPEAHYFVMGDNSDRSEDGRFWGFVPDENLAGKAVYVWMHKKPGLWNLPTLSYNRSID